VSPSDTRRRRQLEQLAELCGRGAVDRAIDLAFEHFAAFGQDDSVVVLLEGACASRSVRCEVRRRIDALRAANS
jgi:hypothetical protein